MPILSRLRAAVDFLWTKHIVAAFVLTVVTAGVLSMASGFWKGESINDVGDNFYVMSIFLHGWHGLMQGSFYDIYDLKILFPMEQSLAFSENIFLLTLVGLPFYLITDNVFLSHNAVFGIGFVAISMSMYSLAFNLFHHRLGAIVSAILFTFCAYEAAHFSGHLQMLGIWSLLLALVLIRKWVSTGSVGWLVAACLLHACLFIQNIYYFVYACYLMPLWALVLLWRSENRWRRFGQYIAGMALASLPFLPFMWKSLEATILYPNIPFSNDAKYSYLLDLASPFRGLGFKWLANLSPGAENAGYIGFLVCVSLPLLCALRDPNQKTLNEISNKLNLDFKILLASALTIIAWSVAGEYIAPLRNSVSRGFTIVLVLITWFFAIRFTRSNKVSPEFNFLFLFGLVAFTLGLGYNFGGRVLMQILDLMPLLSKTRAMGRIIVLSMIPLTLAPCFLLAIYSKFRESRQGSNTDERVARIPNTVLQAFIASLLLVGVAEPIGWFGWKMSATAYNTRAHAEELEMRPAESCYGAIEQIDPKAAILELPVHYDWYDDLRRYQFPGARNDRFWRVGGVSGYQPDYVQSTTFWIREAARTDGPLSTQAQRVLDRLPVDFVVVQPSAPPDYHLGGLVSYLSQSPHFIILSPEGSSCLLFQRTYANDDRVGFFGDSITMSGLHSLNGRKVQTVKEGGVFGIVPRKPGQKAAFKLKWPFPVPPWSNIRLVGSFSEDAKELPSISVRVGDSEELPAHVSKAGFWIKLEGPPLRYSELEVGIHQAGSQTIGLRELYLSAPDRPDDLLLGLFEPHWNFGSQSQLIQVHSKSPVVFGAQKEDKVVFKGTVVNAVTDEQKAAFQHKVYVWQKDPLGTFAILESAGINEDGSFELELSVGNDGIQEWFIGIAKPGEETKDTGLRIELYEATRL